MSPGDAECTTKEPKRRLQDQAGIPKQKHRLWLMPNVPIAQMCCSNNISWVKKPADSTRFPPDVRKCDVCIRKELSTVRGLH